MTSFFRNISISFGISVMAVFSSVAFSSLAWAACPFLVWSCFDSTVAIVGRTADGAVGSFCSGVAISRRQVLTAGHCAESLSRGAIVRIDVYSRAAVPFGSAPDAEGRRETLRRDDGYDRSHSYYLHDRGSFELDRDLPADLNFPLLASASDVAVQDQVREFLKVGAGLERIGFGQRVSSVTGELGNRRTWMKPKIDGLLADVIVTDDHGAMPGDSGGPLFLFIPGTGLVLVGLHSTWDPTSERVFSPRVH